MTTTKQFIAHHLHTAPQKEKYFCSVLQATNGDFYSYGYHYPLLVNFKGYRILNNAGYSMTTAKHISWASQYAHFSMPFKPDQAWRWLSTDEQKKSYLLECLQLKISDLQNQIITKKRHNTAIYRALQSDISHFLSLHEKITSL